MKEIKPRKKRADAGKPRVKKEKKEEAPAMAAYQGDYKIYCCIFDYNRNICLRLTEVER